MIWYVKKKEEEIGSESFTFQMKLLQKKLEDDRKRVEEQFRTDMKTQTEVMKAVMTANIEEMRIGTQAIIKQNKALQNTVTSMKKDSERQDGKILELQSEIAELREPCVIL